MNHKHTHTHTFHTSLQVQPLQREVMTWKEIWLTVDVHQVSHLELPDTKAKRGKTALLTDTIKISVFTKNEETGKDVQVGKGWTVGEY